MEGMSRKKSVDVSKLPEVPQIPQDSQKKLPPKSDNNDSLFSSLYGFKDRETSFYKALNENIKIFDNESKNGSDINRSADMSSEVKSACEEECRDYITPLMNRTQGSISNMLAIKDSLDQLDSLHRIIQQLLTVQEQNYQMRKRLRTVKTLHVLKEMEIQMNSDPEKFIKTSMEDGSDLEIDIDFEQNIADLEAVLAASKSASNKRNNSKKLRSKSIMSDDIAFSAKENYRNYPLRRQSAISDFKPKVSKWKAVKAAFKWEKTNTLTLNESKSSDSVLSPSPNENTKYFLRVPTTPMACSSGDSLFSTSSGRNFATSGGASGQSSGDENDETTKSKSFIRAPSFHDEERRSHSLDGDLTYGSHSLQHSPSEKNKINKSAWSKVKGIVINRNSRKSLKSTGSVNSRDVSPIDLLNEGQRDRSEDSISSPNQPSSPCNLGVPEIDLCPTSDESEYRNDGRRSMRATKRSSRKGKLIPEIESLPEGMPLVSKPLPSPLILKRDFSESDGLENFNSLTKFIQRKYSISDPNSPQRNQEFFSENDFSSGADNSEPLRRGASNNSSRSSRQHDEILKNYEDLQRKIAQEFDNKQQEWSRVRPLVVQLNTSVPPYLKEDSSLPSTPKSAIENLLRNEENLSADFKRKLEEWRTKKSQQSMKEKKHQQSPDWHAWKTGQMKFENQGLIALPDAKNLPEDFQKKLNEWKQMKAEGKSPPYSTQTSVQEKFKRQFSKSDSKSSESGSFKKSKTIDEKSECLSKIKPLNPPREEIVVKTSEGLLKFKGISKSFTMKLYEWEKSKGIAPESESSAFAFLHPKYQELIDENGNVDENDKSSGMKRAMSVDSIKPTTSSTQISHQPSSLSLNDADNLKETDNKKVSSTPTIQIYCGEKINIQPEMSTDEPEAVIVEVEDDGLEFMPVSAETTPLQIQIPIFKFDFANRDSKHDLKMDVNKTLSEIRSCLNKIEFYLHKNSKSIKHENLKVLTDKFYNMRELLQHLSSSIANPEVELSIQSTCDFLIMLENSPPSSKFSQLLIEKLADFKKLANNFLTNERNTSEFQATRSIQVCEDNKAIATVKITPTFMCNTFSVKIDEQIKPPQLKVTSESEMPELSTEDMKSDEKKRVVRNTSNTSKRKIRLRRMGSRQNSKTESDSDEEFAQNPEAQRKAKRKTSRAKKQLESDKSFDSFQGEEEVVYVFKIKPGETNEVIVKANDSSADIKHDDSILISPTENCVELIDAHEFCSQNQSSFAIPIVKTKRKIFTPVDDNNCTKTCISHDIESSSSSEKTSDKKVEIEVSPIHVNAVPIVKSQPPEKPPRKHEFIKQGSNKDLSPSIRRMIDIYNHNIDDKTMCSKSGSSSPLWLSPILDRRVRKQSEDYQDKVAKSSSAGHIPQEVVFIKEDKSQTDTEAVCEITIEEQKPTEIAQVEEPIIVKEAFQLSTGAIPKVYVETSIESDVVQMRENKPKTPLSERANKIRQAKEAFFKAPSSQPSSLELENYRLSQISIGSMSTISNSIENISSSASLLPTNYENIKKLSIDSNPKTSSLPRNVQNSDGSQDSPKSSKFGLSSIATKLRKVKLKKSSKDVDKMNTIPLLCRQSLNVDFVHDSEPQPSSKPEKSQSAFRFKKNKNEIVKKSKSLGLL